MLRLHHSHRQNRRQLGLAALLLSTLTLLGCRTAAPPEASSEDNMINIGVEPATQNLVEGILAIYEASESLPKTVLLLDTSEEAAAKVERGELDFAIIYGLPADSSLFSVPIAEDYLSAVVPSTAEITELSIQNLADILRGAITNWSQVGGPDEMILVIAPPQGSSILQTTIDLVMPAQAFSTSSLVSFSDEQSIQTIARTSGSIGIVRSTSLIGDVRALVLYDSVADSAAGSHVPAILAESVYFIAAQEPQGEIRQLLNWVLSSAGQNALKSYLDGPPNEPTEDQGLGISR